MLEYTLNVTHNTVPLVLHDMVPANSVMDGAFVRNLTVPFVVDNMMDDMMDDVSLSPAPLVNNMVVVHNSVVCNSSAMPLLVVDNMMDMMDHDSMSLVCSIAISLLVVSNATMRTVFRADRTAWPCIETIFVQAVLLYSAAFPFRPSLSIQGTGE